MIRRVFSDLVSKACQPLWLGVVILLVGTMGIASAPRAAEVIVSDIRVGVHTDKTRIVLDLSKPVDASMFLLKNPYRVVIDLPEAGWQMPSGPLPGKTGIFSTLRYGLYQPGQSRLVIEASAPPAIHQVFYLAANDNKPHRLVIDLAESDATAFAKTLHSTTQIAANSVAVPEESIVESPELPAVTQTLEAALEHLPAAPRKPSAPLGPVKRVIAIDAGHGGADPGAIGRSGVYEKHITLAFAKEMKKVLEASGRYNVVLVRDRDVFIPLRQRVAKARQAKPDLFISLHADTIKNARTRGLSVYTLSETASDKEAALLAEKENKADIVAGMDFNNEPPEVANILIDLAQRESMNESARFANTLIRGAQTVTKVLRNTHRFAGFAVLKAPDVPSVLVELGFLSNKTDEKNLQSRAYRRQFSEAALRSLDDYFANVQQANTY